MCVEIRHFVCSLKYVVNYHLGVVLYLYFVSGEIISITRYFWRDIIVTLRLHFHISVEHKVPYPQPWPVCVDECLKYSFLTPCDSEDTSPTFHCPRKMYTPTTRETIDHILYDPSPTTLSKQSHPNKLDNENSHLSRKPSLQQSTYVVAYMTWSSSKISE